MILVTLASRILNAELAMRAGFKSLPQRGLASKGLLRQRLAIEGSAEKVWGRVFDPPAKGGATYLFVRVRGALACARHPSDSRPSHRDRKSTRLNSSHLVISYAVFCLKKKRQ